MSAKTITITDPKNGNKYELEFSRKEASKLEQRGITPKKLLEDGMEITLVWELFSSAFNMHCARVSNNDKERLFELVKGKFVEKLIDMYAECVNSLTDDTSEDEDEGNAIWEASW